MTLTKRSSRPSTPALTPLNAKTWSRIAVNHNKVVHAAHYPGRPIVLQEPNWKILMAMNSAIRRAQLPPTLRNGTPGTFVSGSVRAKALANRRKVTPIKLLPPWHNYFRR